MKVFGFYKSKKYFQRVMFSIMVSMVVVLAASSVSNTYVLESSIKKIQEDSNLKVLSQIQYNLSYMNDIIIRLSHIVYRDQFLIPLMFSEDVPKMDLIRAHRQMSNIMESSSFLHSMVIYNKAQSELYGTSVNFMLDGGVTKQRIRDELVDAELPQPTNRLLPMSLEADNGRIDTFAFIITDSLKSFSSSQSAIILFIKSDWVFDSLRKMNVVSDSDQGEIYIRTQDGRLLSSSAEVSYAGGTGQETLLELIGQDKPAGGHDSGFVIGELFGRKSVITYMDAGLGAWTILYLQDYEQLVADVARARNQSMLLSGLFMLAAVALSIWLSYKLYDPIENMLRQIKPHLTNARPSDSNARDELGLMSENYRMLSEQLHEISSEQIVSKYYIRKFLTDSSLFLPHDMRHLIEKHQLNIAAESEWMVCVLKIDHFAAYDRESTNSSKMLYNFAILNIAAEIIGKNYPCEAAEMRGDHIVLILSPGSGKDAKELVGQVKPRLREIQRTVEQYYGLSLSCGVSDPIVQQPYLSSAYMQALKLCQYKLVKGHQSIIASEDVEPNLSSRRAELPAGMERKLAEALKKGQLTNAGNELEKAFAHLAAFNYDDIIRALSNLAWLIRNVASEINDNRMISFGSDLEHIHHFAQEKETLEEIYVAFLSVCAQICEGQRPANMERNEMMLETVKELIEQKFADCNLSQQSIASTVKLSSAYIGKLFKESYKLSITEYINEVRLAHAQKLLEQDNYSIAEIMDKCGYSNQSYFFRLFKGKVGSTPKEYRMKKSIS